MFLGHVRMETIMAVHLQLAAGNAPVTADAAPNYEIYAGDQSTAVANGALSGEVNSLQGWHLFSQSIGGILGFAPGIYALRVTYEQDSIEAVQTYTFQVVA